MSRRLAVGFDVSTQSCKCVAVDVESLEIMAASVVHYDTELSHFKTINGVHRNGQHVTSPPLMWFEAMKLSLSKLSAVLPLPYSLRDDVAVVSGSAQQHASVYWALEFGSKWDATCLPTAGLTVTESPVWLDNSTSEECRLLVSKLGDGCIAKLTGSRATERFSIHHVVALRSRNPEAFAATKSVCLASSFATSMLCGRVCGNDACDAAGMNAMDIDQLQWSSVILDALDIDEKILGPLVDPTMPLPERVCDNENVASTWGDLLPPRGTQIVPFCGDNPCALVGMGVFETGDVVISLGTSDTCMFVTEKKTMSSGGALLEFAHTFPHPLFPHTRQFHMLVYSNGDVARRHVRDAHCNGSWDVFEEDLATYNADNAASYGVFWTCDEISPRLAAPRTRVLVHNGELRVSAEYSQEEEEERQHRNAAGACIAFRAMTMRLHLSKMGLDAPHAIRRLLITGGAANNRGILSLFADVFQCDVHCLEMPDAAAYGGALRGIFATSTSENKERLLAQSASSGVVVARPTEHGKRKYANGMIDIAMMYDYLQSS